MKKLLKIFVIILAVGFALFSWSWFSAKRALVDYVHKVQPGMQVTEARSYAKQKGLKYVISSYKDEMTYFSPFCLAYDRASVTCMPG